MARRAQRLRLGDSLALRRPSARRDAVTPDPRVCAPGHRPQGAIGPSARRCTRRTRITVGASPPNGSTTTATCGGTRPPPPQLERSGSTERLHHRPVSTDRPRHVHHSPQPSPGTCRPSRRPTARRVNIVLARKCRESRSCRMSCVRFMHVPCRPWHEECTDGCVRFPNRRLASREGIRGTSCSRRGSGGLARSDMATPPPDEWAVAGAGTEPRPVGLVAMAVLSGPR
jgi:hypothetical protein